MKGIDLIHCDVTVKIVLEAYFELMNSGVVELLDDSKYGKNDAAGIDAIPEIVIRDGIMDFNPSSILITEETDIATSLKLSENPSPKNQPLIFVSDPTDRSKYLKRFIRELLLIKYGLNDIEKNEDSETKETVDQQKKLRVGEILGDIGSDNISILKLIRESKNAIAVWEELGGAPASITGAVSSLTCVSEGKVVCSVLVNVITRQIFVACETGVYYCDIEMVNDRPITSFDDIVNIGNRLYFPTPDFEEIDSRKQFVTFLGKAGYQENFDTSMIFMGNSSERYVHHKEPGGPSRVLYLSELQKEKPIGFIMANGEKITEWIHWLSFIKFARNQQNSRVLSIFEVSSEKVYTKNGILMSTHPEYSIFKSLQDILYMDFSILKGFKQPSHYRSMIAVSLISNKWFLNTMERNNNRSLIVSDKFYF